MLSAGSKMTMAVEGCAEVAARKTGTVKKKAAVEMMRTTTEATKW